MKNLGYFFLGFPNYLKVHIKKVVLVEFVFLAEKYLQTECCQVGFTRNENEFRIAKQKVSNLFVSQVGDMARCNNASLLLSIIYS